MRSLGSSSPHCFCSSCRTYSGLVSRLLKRMYWNIMISKVNPFDLSYKNKSQRNTEIEQAKSWIFNFILITFSVSPFWQMTCWGVESLGHQSLQLSWNYLVKYLGFIGMQCLLKRNDPLYELQTGVFMWAPRDSILPYPSFTTGVVLLRKSPVPYKSLTRVKCRFEICFPLGLNSAIPELYKDVVPLETQWCRTLISLTSLQNPLLTQ